MKNTTIKMFENVADQGFDLELDVAVVGLSCRFPGANTASDFWQNLITGKRSISEIPEGRWRWRDYWGDPKSSSNKTNIKWGGFIDDVDKFDPFFFNISPKEAASMDPQHRLFLQSSWHAIEDAGYCVSSLSGRKIGVYAGVSKNDYAELMRESGEEISPFISTGTVHSILANRISFQFNFRGPSIAVDTACSSGLVALHSAIKDMREGECEAALVGAVNTLLAPTMYISHSKSGFLSLEGQCFTFDAAANGYVRGEGVGVLVIKPLKKALVDGDNVQAVIKGSAVNHGGRANFLTSPTVEAQADVIISALDKAKIDPSTISYIEAHGTGTPLGDPIEINGLKKAFSARSNSEVQASNFCALSSVKTNIGHLECVAGIAGIIKVILSLRHGEIPALQNFRSLNPYIELDDSPFYLAEKNIPWQANTTEQRSPRRAGVSSFGMGGVNAHVILQEAPVIPLDTSAQTSALAARPELGCGMLMVPLSIKKGSLQQYAKTLHSHLLLMTKSGEIDARTLQNIVYTLQTGREQFAQRLAIIAENSKALLNKLERYVNGGNDADVFSRSITVKKGEKPQQVTVNNEMNAREVAQLWTEGATLDWSLFYRNNGDRARMQRMSLPTYPFEKKRCWFNNTLSSDGQRKNLESSIKPGVKPNVKSSGASKNIATRRLHTDDFFIRDHVVQGEKMLPGVAYMEFARAAFSELNPQLTEVMNTIEDVYWLSPVRVKQQDRDLEFTFSDGASDAQTGTSLDKHKGKSFKVFLDGTMHCRGRIRHTKLALQDTALVDIQDLQQRYKQTKDPADLYQIFSDHGLDYGPSFQPIQDCIFSQDGALAQLQIPDSLKGNMADFVLHPCMADGIFQTIVALSVLGENPQTRQYVPFHLKKITIIRPIAQRCYAHAWFAPVGNKPDEMTFDAVLCNVEGEVLVRVEALTKRAIGHLPKNDKVELNADKTTDKKVDKKGDKNNIYYQSIWQPQSLEPPLAEHSSAPFSSIIVFADDVRMAQKIIKTGSNPGSVIQVLPGEAFSLVDDHHIVMNKRSADDYQKLFKYLKGEKISVSAILYLWSFSDDQRTPSDLLALGLTAMLRLTKSLMTVRAYKRIKLLYVYNLSHEAARPYHAMIGGFARTLIYENPNLRYDTLGLVGEPGRGFSQENLIQVLSELAMPRLEKLHEIRYHEGNRQVRKVTEYTNPDVNFNADREDVSAQALIKTGGVYLISGGAGGLGFLFAQHLSKYYRATVLLLGRSQSNAKIEEKVSVVRALGGGCDYYSADIGDREGLSTLLQHIILSHGTLNGVIHAAGVIEDAYILRKKESVYDKVVRPKVLGLVNLDELTKHEKLDFFMMFSSIASLMPNQGQSDYAAANSFLDCYADYRNTMARRGKRYGGSLAINWPLWADGGMQVTAEEEAHLLKVFGMRPLAKDLGMSIFEYSLQLMGHKQAPAQLFAIDGDKQKIAQCLGMDAEQYSLPAVVSEELSVETVIRGIFSAQFDIAADKIDGSANISEFGLDSLSLLNIVKQVNEAYSAGVKPTIFFEINSIDKFIQYVADKTHSFRGPQRSKSSQSTSNRVEEASVNAIETLYDRHNCSLVDVSKSNPEIGLFKRTFRCAEFYLKDHVVEGQYNMPGACYIEMARQAAALLLDEKTAVTLSNNYWVSQLSSPGKDFDAYIQFVEKGEGYEYEVFSYAVDAEQALEVGQKRVHAMGRLSTKTGKNDEPAPQEYCDLAAIRSRCQATQYPDQVYRQIIAEGLHVGPTFMPMLKIELNKTEALATLRLPESIADTLDDYVLHPTMLTGFFQTALISNRYDDPSDHGLRYIPIGIDDITVFGAVTENCFVYSSARKKNQKNTKLKKYDIRICQPDGLVVVTLKGFAIRALVDEPVTEAVVIAPSVQMNNSSPNNINQNNTSLTVSDSVMIKNAEIDDSQIVDATNAYLKQLLAEPLGIPADEIEVGEDFENYGINSVMIVELNKVFEDIFGPLSKTLFFEYVNLEELAEFFIDNYTEVLKNILNIASTPSSKETAQDVGAEKPVMPKVDLPKPVAPEHRPEITDIAIIGVDGRYPGANNMDEFWQVLKEGRDCIRDVPAGRFDYSAFFDKDPEQDKIYTTQGGFIDDVDKFDPMFFNISPREAELIDPQERLFLEVVWGMMEDAGYTRKSLQDRSDGQVGVFVGALWQPYQAIGSEQSLQGNPIAPSGLLYSIANRISYYFNLSGPSLAIDTACSSSLTALHMACQSLHLGDCKMAVVGGVNLSLHSSKYLFLCQNRFLSTDGRCRSFGAGGDGYVPGEGIGAILLKPLDQAERDGDRIYSVIKSSAVNHGGKTNGYTVPNPNAQGDLIKQALTRAKIDPRSISYMEAHGTGTPLGDPIEITGLNKAFSAFTKEKQFCAIGSVKSNIGHLEAAAGIAAVSKVILQMKYRQLVPSIHADTLNSNIQFDQSPFTVQRDLADWLVKPADEAGGETQSIRRAGISSFGAGGANAHVILEEYIAKIDLNEHQQNKGVPQLVPVSARTEKQLREQVENLQKHLSGTPSMLLEDLVYTLQTGRESMNQRLALIVNSIDELNEGLQRYLDNHPIAPEMGLYGSIKDNKSMVDVLSGGQAAKEFVRAVAQQGDYKKLMKLWVNGVEIDWSLLYEAKRPRIVSLPRYPFAKDHCWLPLNKPDDSNSCTTNSGTTNSGTTNPGTSNPDKNSAVVQDPAAISGIAQLHPMLHENTSTLYQQRFTSYFTGDEFFLRDHVVQREKVLPGVAYLEMAYQAVYRASDEQEARQLRDPQGSTRSRMVTLHNVVWSRPIVVDNKSGATNEARPVHIRLSPENDGRISYEIYTEASSADASLETPQHVNHSQGIADVCEVVVPVALDLVGLKEKMQVGNVAAIAPAIVPGMVSATDCYQHFQAMGLNYGPAHQGIDKVYLGEGEALAELTLPPFLNAQTSRYTLHPSLMDAALQVSLLIGESLDDLNAAKQTKLPFALQRIDVIKPCQTKMWAWVRYCDGAVRGAAVQKFDIDLVDADGNICVRLKAFSTRTLSKPVDANPTIDPVGLAAGSESMVSGHSDTVLMRPVWQPENISLAQQVTQAYQQRVVFIVGFAALLSDIQKQLGDYQCIGLTTREDEQGILAGDSVYAASHFERTAIHIFNALQTALKQKPTGSLLVQLVVADYPENFGYEAIAAMFKTAKLESRKIIAQSLRVPASHSVQALVSCVNDNASDQTNTRIRYRDTVRQVSRLVEYTPAQPQALSLLPWRSDGVYLITGGLGELGLIFAESIAKQSPGAALILTGRSTLDNTKRQILATLQARGANAFYQQVDVSDVQKTGSLIQVIEKDFGALTGIIHAAGINSDSYLVNKNDTEFKQVLAPKVSGCVNLDRASQHQNALEFFILFSSVVAELGNVGQADYATANAYMDAFAEYRNILVAKQQRFGKTLAINWPLWAQGGMQVDESAAQMMKSQMGMTMMPSASGLQAFKQCLAHEGDQVLVMYGVAADIKQKLLPDLKTSVNSANNLTEQEQEPGNSREEIASLLQASLLKKVASVLKVKIDELDGDTELSDYGFDSISLTTFSNDLNRDFDLGLTPTIFFEHPTLQSLAEYLLDEHFPALQAKFGGGEQTSVVTELSTVAPALNASEQASELQLQLLQQVSTILKISHDELDVDTELSDFGFDSISLTSFTNRINQVYQLSLTPTLFFEYPTITGLTEYLCDNYSDNIERHLNQPSGRASGKNIKNPQAQPLPYAARAAHQRFALVQPQELPSQQVQESGSPTLAKQSLEGAYQAEIPVNEPIAIVGISACFPKAQTIQQFWQNLSESKDCISEIPASRWDWQALYGDPHQQPNSSNIKWGGFIDGVDEFDPLFFGISPREAELMDPQQRLLMRYVWLLIEDAGYSAASLSGTNTGMFIGTAASGYSDLLAQAGTTIESYSATGMVPSVGPNRMSHFLNLRGPSEPIETACSSSLVAVHRALQSIRTGDCEMAIVGGVNVLVTPQLHISFNKAGMLCEDGRCKTFSDQANGYVRGEGVGMLMLKKLGAAERDGDHIYAVLRGSAVNHGGRANSLTAPNAKAQAEVVCAAYENAKIDPRTITYIETHGTGTSLGDPVEINGLKSAFEQLYQNDALNIAGGEIRAENSHCGLGSVKTNIGHLEYAAGMAGIIKVLLQFKHQTLVKTLHCDTLNPYISLDNSPFHIVTKNQPWQPLTDRAGRDIPRRAGVSSFGFGGVNAHVVLEEYAVKATPQLENDARLSAGPYLIILSAKNRSRLSVLAKTLSDYLTSPDAQPLALVDIAYTLQVGREAMEERMAMVVNSKQALLEKLQVFCARVETDSAEHIEGIYTGHSKKNKGTLALFSSDEELKEVVDKWIARKKYNKLLDLWVKGLAIDWHKLYGSTKAKRLSLPGYPFVKQRYWAAAPKQDLMVEPRQAHNDDTLVKCDNSIGSDLPELMFFAENWQAQALPLVNLSLETEGQTLLCFLSNAQKQRAFSEAVKLSCPKLTLVFVSNEKTVDTSLNSYAVQAHDNASYRQVLDQVNKRHGSIDSVLYLWSMDDTRGVNDTMPLLYLLQAIGQSSLQAKRILLGAQCKNALNSCFVQSWIGLERSLAMVLPDTEMAVLLEGEVAGLMDAHHGDQGLSGVSQWALLCLQTLYQTSFQSTAYCQQKHHVLTKKTVQPTALTVSQIKHSGVYLITGGCGSLGQIFTRHLAEHYAAKLIITGRGALNEKKQLQVAALEKLGASVIYLQADVCDQRAMSSGLSEALQRFGKLDGVINAAGIESGGSLLDKKLDDFNAVLAAKITGTQVLDGVLESLPEAQNLDFVCYFSSNSAIIGDFGACDYAMANRYLMAHADYRNQLVSKGLRKGRTFVINWPLWAPSKESEALGDELGMTVGSLEKTHFYLQSSGQALLLAQVGIEVFERLLSQEFSQCLVMYGNAERVSRFLGQTSTADRLLTHDKVIRSSLSIEASAEVRAESRTPESKAGLMQELKTIAANLLKLDIAVLDEHSNLADFGFDSFAIADFSRKLSKHYNISLVPSVFFSYPTLSKLCSHLLAKYGVTFDDGCESKIEEKPPSQVDDNTKAQKTVPTDIAIIGLSGRFPQAESVDELWRVLAQGRSSIEDIPKDRWDWADYFIAPGHEKNQITTNKGGFLSNTEMFDPLFFEISPREARDMDPRQRLLLQESWHALEDAGLAGGQIQGSCCGVFIGVEDSEDGLSNSEGLVTGKHSGILAARISYFLDLSGPNLSLNTACSSGLVALHQACQALRQEECDTALAGGISLIQSPVTYKNLSKMGMLSQQGQCHTFDQRAAGIVPSEAVTIVVLKPLAKAVADQDRIYGVVKASGVNYDGKTNGITAPSGISQQALLEKTYQKYAINTDNIDYFLAHGTGTKLGDPIEVNALNEVFTQSGQGSNGAESKRCVLGSVKTNFGHSLAASGLVSLVSALKAMENKQIPATVGFDHENEFIQFEQGPFYVNRTLRDWPKPSGRPRTAAISAFGMSGTNAHIVLEEYDANIRGHLAVTQPKKNTPIIIVLSAKEPEQLDAALVNLRDYLNDKQKTKAQPNLQDIAFTLQVGREAMPYRLALVVDRWDSLAGAVSQLAEGDASGIDSYRARVVASQSATTANGLVGADVSADKTQLIKLAKAWVNGQAIDWLQGYRSLSPQKISLPGYPFVKKRFPRGVSPEVTEYSNVLPSGSTDNKANGNKRRLSDARSVSLPTPSDLSEAVTAPVQLMDVKQYLRKYVKERGAGVDFPTSKPTLMDKNRPIKLSSTRSVNKTEKIKRKIMLVDIC